MFGGMVAAILADMEGFALNAFDIRHQFVFEDVVTAGAAEKAGAFIVLEPHTADLAHLLLFGRADIEQAVDYCICSGIFKLSVFYFITNVTQVKGDGFAADSFNKIDGCGTFFALLTYDY